MKDRKPLFLTLICALVIAVMLPALLRQQAPRNKSFKAQPTKTQTTTTPLPTLQGAEAIAHLQEQGQYQSLKEAVEKARYEIQWEGGTTYHALNPAQQYKAYFTANELVLTEQPLSADGINRGGNCGSTTASRWQTRMELIGYGYGDDILPVTSGEMKANGNRLEITRKVRSQESGVRSRKAEFSSANYSGLRTQNSELTEWYINKAEGLEQGFTINAPPVAVGSQQKAEGNQQKSHWRNSLNSQDSLDSQLPLRIALAVKGDLRAQLTKDGEAIELLDRTGGTALRYSKLYAYDATGRELTARMQVEQEQVYLEVEDAGAIYPLTIDPQFTIQQIIEGGNFLAIMWQSAAIRLSYPGEPPSLLMCMCEAKLHGHNRHFYSQTQCLVI